MPTILHFLIAALVMRFAPSPAPAGPTRTQLTPDACYSIKMGLFQPGTGGLDPERLPLTVRFNSQSYQFLTGVHVLQPNINIASINYGFWEHLAADSVRFGWVYAYSYDRFDVHAKVTSDSLTGVAFSSTYRPFNSVAEVSGVRVTCPRHLRDREGSSER